MSVSSETARRVQDRANDRCEYCLMHQSLQGATFHVEHILHRSQGGSSTEENLCWACPGCNLHKSDRTVVRDPQSDLHTAHFNPRHDAWSEHFSFDGFEIVGLTDVGRATVVALHLNHERRLHIRSAEALFGLFPPGAE